MQLPENLTKIDEDKLKLIFSSNIKKLLTQSGISESELSVATGISQSAINRIKHGSVCPSLSQVLKIANFFKVDIEDMIKEIEEKDYQNGNCIPIINARDFIQNGAKNIQGFYFSKQLDGLVGFKYDSSFASKIFNKDIIILTKRITDLKNIPNNSMLLFVDNTQFYHVGYYFNSIIKPIDNPNSVYDINTITIIGDIALIESKYIKDLSAIKKILDSIGEQQLIEAINKNLGLIS